MEAYKDDNHNKDDNQKEMKAVKDNDLGDEDTGPGHDENQEKRHWLGPQQQTR